jgi:ABC-type transport system involved in multi-copper enzyme maturation permease subunit
MRQVILIAINFVREQRWPILMLMLWVVILSCVGLVVSPHRFLVIFKQSAVYVVLFAGFFGASAIHNERKTRRILAVLSKGVARWQYISGLLAGIVLATGIYCISIGVTATWVLEPDGFDISHLWFLMLCLMLGCLLAATVAVMFSTFLNPLFSTLATAIVLLLPAVAAVDFGAQAPAVVPVYGLVQQLTEADFGPFPPASQALLWTALIETLIFWWIAAWIFSRRDIAVAVD